MASRRVSVAVVAPIPPASETTATRQVSGDFAMLRIATRTSWVKSAIVGVRRRHHIAVTFQSSLPVRDRNHTTGCLSAAIARSNAALPASCISVPEAPGRRRLKTKVGRNTGHPLAGGQIVGRSLRQNYKMLAPSSAPHLSPFLQWDDIPNT
jgi:hypothetical protein